MWVAGLAGAAVLVVGGIALASSKGSASATCNTWTKASSNAEAISSALNLNSASYPPGTYLLTYQGQQVKYVNNMDGTNNTDPDTPSGSTSIYVCTG